MFMASKFPILNGLGDMVKKKEKRKKKINDTIVLENDLLDYPLFFITNPNDLLDHPKIVNNRYNCMIQTTFSNNIS